MAKHRQIKRTRNLLYKEKGGDRRGCENKSPLEEAGSTKYGGFSLVGLVQSLTDWAVRAERSFLFPAG